MEHVLRAPFSSRLLFVRAWVKLRAFGKVSDRLPRSTFWSIPSTSWWKVWYFLTTSFWKWEKTSLAFYSKAETQRKGHNFDKFWAWLEWLCSRTKRFTWAAGVAMLFDDFLKVEEYLPVIICIAGYVCFAINKRLKCIYCKLRVISGDGDFQYFETSFINGISRSCRLFPSPEMVRIALITYLVIIKICERDEYQKCSSQRDFAVKLVQSVLETEHFLLSLMAKCENNHDPRTIVEMTCWICSNILLNNYCFKTNDRLTSDKLSRKRKLQTSTWFDKCMKSLTLTITAFNQPQLKPLACTESPPPLSWAALQIYLLLCLLTPGSDSSFTSACPWLWSEGTVPAYWPVCKFDPILPIPKY